MQPTDPTPEPIFSSGAVWLNGIVWAIMVTCFLWALALHSYEALIPIFIILLAASLGAVANLLTGLWLIATNRGQQAGAYLANFVPLALLTWWLAKEFGDIHKIGG